MLKNNRTVFKMSPPFADCEESNAFDNHLLKESSGRQQFDSTTDSGVVTQIIVTCPPKTVPAAISLQVTSASERVVQVVGSKQ
jgi:hypothetical protein